MTNQWRLVNGRELYDIRADHEQRYDVAGQHPGVVVHLRDEYEKWWQIVSRQYDEMIPLVIGSTPITLNNHDMRNDDCNVAFTQGQVPPRGTAPAGYWEIEVEEGGTYEFALRRWPATEHTADIVRYRWRRRPVRAGQHSRRELVLLHWRQSPAHPREASLCVQGRSLTKAVCGDDSAAVFRVELEKGKTVVQAWFSDGHSAITSAYYVDVARCSSSTG